MNIKKVLDDYALLSNVSRDEALSKYPLAALAISRVNSWLKAETDPKDEPILTMLAAALVNLWVANANASSSGPTSFKGNGYTILKDSSKEIDAAKVEFDRWKAECSYLLTDTDFAFYSTKKSPKEAKNESAS